MSTCFKAPKLRGSKENNVASRKAEAKRVPSIRNALYISTPGGGASRDGLGVLVRTAFPLFKNHTSAHDLPHPSWVERKVPLTADAPTRSLLFGPREPLLRGVEVPQAHREFQRAAVDVRVAVPSGCGEFLGIPRGFGWHYLSTATCLMRPRLFYVLFVVSRITIICCVARHFRRKHVLDEVVSDKWFPTEGRRLRSRSPRPKDRRSFTKNSIICLITYTYIHTYTHIYTHITYIYMYIYI